MTHGLQQDSRNTRNRVNWRSRRDTSPMLIINNKGKMFNPLISSFSNLENGFGGPEVYEGCEVHRVVETRNNYCR